jgi:hypothetical protein
MKRDTGLGYPFEAGRLRRRGDACRDLVKLTRMRLGDLNHQKIIPDQTGRLILIRCLGLSMNSFLLSSTCGRSDAVETARIYHFSF